jgi:hypothetical protein
MASAACCLPARPAQPRLAQGDELIAAAFRGLSRSSAFGSTDLHTAPGINPPGQSAGNVGEIPVIQRAIGIEAQRFSHERTASSKRADS